MIVKADAILAGSGLEPTSPGMVRIEGDQIVGVGPDVSVIGDRIVDFAAQAGPGRQAVILPGFINCHCHLELSDLAGRLRFRGSLVRWLGELVLKRPKTWSRQARAVRQGAEMSLAGGTTTIADISANGRSWRALEGSALRRIVYSEVIGIGRKAARALAELPRRVEALPPPGPRRLGGLSPHAPYSTAESVYRRAMALAGERGLRLTTHLAEDQAELEFVRSATGPWRRVLRTLRLGDAGIEPRGESPVAWAAGLGLLESPAVLAHVNFADDRDIELLAGGRAAVAYCPLAHAYFRHPPHPYRRMVEAGVRVALGTDSAVCSPELSILAEMRAVYRAGGLSPATVLALGTLRGAEALGLADVTGSVEAGKSADLAILWVDCGRADIRRRILETGRLAAVIAGGIIDPGGAER